MSPNIFWLHWINALIDFKRVSFIIQSVLTINYLSISLSRSCFHFCALLSQSNYSPFQWTGCEQLQVYSNKQHSVCQRVFSKMVIRIWCWLSLHESIWRQITSHLLICQLHSVIGREMQIKCASQRRSTQHKSVLNQKILNATIRSTQKTLFAQAEIEPCVWWCFRLIFFVVFVFVFVSEQFETHWPFSVNKWMSCANKLSCAFYVVSHSVKST